MKRSRIPAQHIAPLLRNYLQLDECEAARLPDDPSDYPVRLIVLAERIGAHPNKLRSILTRSKTVEFDLADDLLCAIGCPWQWYSWPLIAFYMAVDLRDSEPKKLLAA